MSVVAFERKKSSGEWSERELSTIVAALGAALNTLWWAIRSTLREKEKAEPWPVEGEELFVQFVPQLAAFA